MFLPIKDLYKMYPSSKHLWTSSPEKTPFINYGTVTRYHHLFIINENSWVLSTLEN